MEKETAYTGGGRGSQDEFSGEHPEAEERQLSEEIVLSWQ